MRKRKIFFVLLTTVIAIGIFSAQPGWASEGFNSFNVAGDVGVAPSRDGNYVALIKEHDYTRKLFYYDLTTGQSTDTSITANFASIKDGKIAYFEGDSGSWPWPTGVISIYDISKTKVSKTHITNAESRGNGLMPSRFFNGEYIVYVDKSDVHVKLYRLADKSIVDIGPARTSNGTSSQDFGGEPVNPEIDGNIVTYTGPNGVVYYNIRTGALTNLDPESGRAVVSGDVISYVDYNSASDRELKYYQISSSQTVGTGITQTYSQSVDGTTIVATRDVYPSTADDQILLFDISTGLSRSSGLYSCGVGSPWYVEISGDKVFYDLCEQGVQDQVTGEWIYEPGDFNGSGEVDCCSGGYSNV